MMDDKDVEIEKLRKENKRLKKELEDTKKEFEKFKAKHASTVQNLHKALKIKPDLPQSPNPIGAKPRHKGHGRKSPIHVDKEETPEISKCPHCNTRLNGKTVSVRERFVTTIRVINHAEVIKYLLYRKWCHSCK